MPSRHGVTQRCRERDQGSFWPAAATDNRSATLIVESLLNLAGLAWPVPDYSTLCRRQNTLAEQLPYHGNGEPLHLLVPFLGHHCVMPCRVAYGAYDGRTCRDAIIRLSAAAIIPPKRNAKPWKKDSPDAGRETRPL